MSFVHLHLHTQYSLLDGVCRFEPLFDAVSAMGQTAAAITDHGNMFGAVDFYKAAKEKGIKPIIGCEVYVAARSRFDKVHGIDSERAHLILLCKNNQGYQNLIKMVSASWVDGFYTKPRIDRELLEQYHEGLIALSACIAGEVPRRLLQNDYEGAKQTALWYRDIFGEDNYYLEIQSHGLREEMTVNSGILRLSRETGIPLVATNDTHYIHKEDAKIQKVLICIQTGHTIEEDTGLDFGTDTFYLRSEAEMRALFPELPEAIENTAKIAERCNVEFEFGKTKLPHFEVPDNRDHYEYFRSLCYEGLVRRYGEHPDKKYIDRLEYELSVIKTMGFVDYYLIVSDFIRYAKSKNIPVGPGRGSGAGSIAAYCIGITGIDPMKYNLLFERFLNPERVSMPDFDVDFCYERRPEVIDYVVDKYGADHVAQIVTFGTMAARAAVRDVGRVLGIPYATVDTVAKQIPQELGMTIDKALAKNRELKTLYDEDPAVKELVDTARSVEGMPRHASTHAAGVVITDKPVAEYVPLARNDEAIVTQYTMTTIEQLGLLKMDFLGLRTLTVISDAEKMIRAKNPDFKIENVPDTDKKTYAMLSSGQTDGVFQCESAGMRSVLTRLKPKDLEDIIAVISLYRPGPMDSIDTYIENRYHPDKIRYKAPQLRDILDVTNGCMVYQEQVMQIFRSLAGYSLGRADIVRRAMSKKKHKVMEEERQYFIHGLKNPDGSVACVGAVQNGISEENANSIFNDMSSFASYAFNKSHSAAYAVVAYRTAYLKCHYPCEFMAALLSSVIENSAKIAGYIGECSRLGIRVLPPHVNFSENSFTAADGVIRFGLLAIKNLGRGFIRTILEERKQGGAYTSFYDFCKRTHGKDFNRRAVEGLIKSGALDNLGLNRREMLLNLPELLVSLDMEKRRNIDGQLGFLDLSADTAVSLSEPTYSRCAEMPLSELLAMEKEITGFYVSDHPMREYKALSEALCSARTSQLLEAENDPMSRYKDGAIVKLLAILTSVKKKVTKSDTTMAFLQAEDMYGGIECIVFAKTLASFSSLLQVGNIVLLRGRLSLKENEEPKLVVDFVEACPEEMPKPTEKTDSAPEKKKRSGLFLRFATENTEAESKCKNLISIFDGFTPVYFYYEDIKKYKQQKLSVDMNDVLLRELKKRLGGKNVIIQ